ncbi:hypothetical protein DPMN_048493 [Dreissena polymorpha]|uniref:Uncharacterized protein n=1 Tax=Dreissena polymorpha TaxID=45954 RepID=A0A9D4D9P7_DREPO|nr:hypothetical protein DPMN_048493 [Dreissena polymorpha]
MQGRQVGGGGGKAVGDDCDYDRDCNAYTPTNELVYLSIGLSVGPCEEDDSDGKDGEDGDNDDGDCESLSENQRPERYFQYFMDKITNPAPA